MCKQGPNGPPSASRAFSECQTVFLVGFMGAGKTSVGRVLAGRLGWAFEDLDDRIQKRESRTVEQIFADAGEAGFREMEYRALRELLDEQNSPPRVVALGGGAFVQPGNAALIEQAGALSVFLDAPPDELFRRCEQEAMVRPLRRSKEQFYQLHESRRPFYTAATLHINTAGKGIDTVAAEIVCLLREHQSIKPLEGVSG
jgi:shikimate kinase